MIVCQYLCQYSMLCSFHSAANHCESLIIPARKFINPRGENRKPGNLKCSGIPRSPDKVSNVNSASLDPIFNGRPEVNIYNRRCVPFKWRVDANNRDAAVRGLRVSHNPRCFSIFLMSSSSSTKQMIRMAPWQLRRNSGST